MKKYIIFLLLIILSFNVKAVIFDFDLNLKKFEENYLKNRNDKNLILRLALEYCIVKQEYKKAFELLKNSQRLFVRKTTLFSDYVVFYSFLDFMLNSKRGDFLESNINNLSSRYIEPAKKILSFYKLGFMRREDLINLPVFSTPYFSFVVYKIQLALKMYNMALATVYNMSKVIDEFYYTASLLAYNTDSKQVMLSISRNLSKYYKKEDKKGWYFYYIYALVNEGIGQYNKGLRIIDEGLKTYPKNRKLLAEKAVLMARANKGEELELFLKKNYDLIADDFYERGRVLYYSYFTYLKPWVKEELNVLKGVKSSPYINLLLAQITSDETKKEKYFFLAMKYLPKAVYYYIDYLIKNKDLGKILNFIDKNRTYYDYVSKNIDKVNDKDFLFDFYYSLKIYSHLEQLFMDNPNKEWLDKLFKLYLENGKLLKLATLIEKVLKKRQDAFLYEYLGKVFIRLKKYDRAKKAFELAKCDKCMKELDEVLAKDRKIFNLRARKILDLANAGEFQKANKEFMNLVESFGYLKEELKILQAQLKAIQVKFKSKKLKIFEEKLKKAKNYKMELLRKKQMLEEKKQTYSKLKIYLPIVIFIISFIGNLLFTWLKKLSLRFKISKMFSNGEYGEVLKLIEEYKKIGNLTDDLMEYYYEALIKNGEYAKAMKILEQLVLTTQRLSYAKKLYKLYKDYNLNDKAFYILTDIINSISADLELLRDYKEVAFLLKNYEEVAFASKKIYELDKDDLDNLQDLIMALEKLERLEEALQYTKILYEKRKDVVTLRKLIQLQEKLEQFDEEVDNLILLLKEDKTAVKFVVERIKNILAKDPANIKAKKLILFIKQKILKK